MGQPFVSGLNPGGKPKDFPLHVKMAKGFSATRERTWKDESWMVADAGLNIQS